MSFFLQIPIVDRFRSFGLPAIRRWIRWLPPRFSQYAPDAGYYAVPHRDRKVDRKHLAIMATKLQHLIASARQTRPLSEDELCDHLGDIGWAFAKLCKYFPDAVIVRLAADKSLGQSLADAKLEV